MAAPSGLCFRETAGGPCLSPLRRAGDDRWECWGGHVWHGQTPNVLKSTPWRYPASSDLPNPMLSLPAVAIGVVLAGLAALGLSARSLRRRRAKAAAAIYGANMATIRAEQHSGEQLILARSMRPWWHR